MTTHGICSRCGFIIECIDPFGCERHDFLGRHYDPIDCIRLLRTELDKVDEAMKKNNQLRYDGEY